MSSSPNTRANNKTNVVYNLPMPTILHRCTIWGFPHGKIHGHGGSPLCKYRNFQYSTYTTLVTEVLFSTLGQTVFLISRHLIHPNTSSPSPPSPTPLPSKISKIKVQPLLMRALGALDSDIQWLFFRLIAAARQFRCFAVGRGGGKERQFSAVQISVKLT